jgi:ankyrin repeat protein
MAASSLQEVVRAIADGTDDEAMSLLEYYSGDINDSTVFGHTPLTAAIRYGRLDVCRVLLARSDVDVHQVDRDLRWSPLAYATRYNTIVLETLLRRRSPCVDVDQQCMHDIYPDWTALHIAAYVSHTPE